MNIKLIALVSSLALFGSGCSSKPKKDFSYMESEEYQKKATLSQSLLAGAGPEALTETSIHKLLESKLAFPKNLNLAIIRLADTSGGLDFQTIDETIAAQFYGKQSWGPRVQSISPVPDLIVVRPVTLNGLRQTAALLQADLMVVIKPMSYTDWEYKIFAPNKAKSTTTLEVLILDTRTSVVPYTTLITATAELKEEKSDYSDYELQVRARKESEKQALLKVPEDVAEFLKQAVSTSALSLNP